MRVLLLITVILTICPDLAGQNDSTLSAIAQQHIYPITYDGSFQGEGWDKVLAAAKTHHYFLIGEDHGIAEIPLFTRSLIENIEYNLFVTEIDSVTAYLAQELSRSSSDQIELFHEQHPSALSFYSAKEEFEILTDLAQNNADIWGLDQVSLFSTGIVFRQLAEVSESKAAKELAIKFANLSDELFAEAVTSVNFDTLFIFSAKQSTFDELREVFEGESKEARQILTDIESSWKIYNGIDNANHSTRITGMKSKLLNYYLDQASSGRKYNKVLYKFGAYHASKGESVFGGYDVGNFAANLAEAEGTSSYHLMIVGKEGEKNTFFPIEGMQKAPFKVNDKGSPLNALIPFTDLVSQEEWAFFDLTAIRTEYRRNKTEIASSFLKAVLAGYDGLIIIPEISPSKQ